MSNLPIPMYYTNPYPQFAYCGLIALFIKKGNFNGKISREKLGHFPFLFIERREEHSFFINV